MEAFLGEWSSFSGIFLAGGRAAVSERSVSAETRGAIRRVSGEAEDAAGRVSAETRGAAGRVSAETWGDAGRVSAETRGALRRVSGDTGGGVEELPAVTCKAMTWVQAVKEGAWVRGPVVAGDIACD